MGFHLFHMQSKVLMQSFTALTSNFTSMWGIYAMAFSAGLINIGNFTLWFTMAKSTIYTCTRKLSTVNSGLMATSLAWTGNLSHFLFTLHSLHLILALFNEFSPFLEPLMVLCPPFLFSS